MLEHCNELLNKKRKKEENETEYPRFQTFYTAKGQKLETISKIQHYIYQRIEEANPNLSLPSIGQNDSL